MDGLSSKTSLSAMVSRCQQLTALNAAPRSVGERVRALSSGLPANLPIRERLAIRSVFMRTVSRIARVHGIGHRPELHAAFFEWAACDLAASTWRTDIETFLDRCANAFAHAAAIAVLPPGDVRTARALQMIASRYNDPTISLGAVAAHARLSDWQLARALKRTLGLGFTSLLHRTRTAAAQRLLEEGSASVKEIAAAVGYSTSSQFCRHFKRLTSTTPARYRAAHAARIA